MIKKFLKKFIHYYETRGRSELNSFFTTFVPAYLGWFIFFAHDHLVALTNGDLSDATFSAIGLALARSIFAAFLSVVFPRQFPVRKP